MDLFKCDKCGHLGPLSDKSGRLIIQEFGGDGQPHAAHYNAKAEVCRTCLSSLMKLLPRADFTDGQDIMREARLLP